jgi:hypothetical protein
MTLIQCPECGHPVSDKALQCGNCSYPIRAAAEVEPNLPPLTGASPTRGTSLSPHAIASLVLFGIVLLAFFFPFQDVILVRFTGLQIAFGKTSSTLINSLLPATHEPDPNGSLFGTLVACGLGLLGSLRFNRWPITQDLGFLVVRGVAAAGAAFGLGNYYSEISQFQVLTDALTGWYWLAACGAVVALGVNVAGIVSIFTGKTSLLTRAS